MALISCPECGKKISDTALTCVGCGAKIKEAIINKEEEEKAETLLKENVKNFVYLLDPLEDYVLSGRIGLSGKVKTYEFMSFTLGISSKTVKQIETDAITKLRRINKFKTKLKIREKKELKKIFRTLIDKSIKEKKLRDEAYIRRINNKGYLLFRKIIIAFLLGLSFLFFCLLIALINIFTFPVLDFVLYILVTLIWLGLWSWLLNAWEWY